MKKILVPTDFSETSIIALETAYEIAKKANAEIYLLCVVEEPIKDSYSVSGTYREEDWQDRLYTFKLLERSKKQLEGLVQDARFSKVKIIGELKLGNAFHGMNKIITEQKVDLVVMGTKGVSDIQTMVIGSNTEKVIRNSHCPVLTVRKKPSTYEFKNIVYATSMSKDEEIVSRVIKNIQALYNSTIHLVRINTPADFQRDRAVKEYMAKYAESLQLKNYTINVYSDIDEEEGIIYFADSIKADLIAMATHGRKGFAHLLAGSIAEDVVNKSSIPVLTYVTKN